MAASLLETVCYVAFVGAVFTLGIAIGSELLTTASTLETVYCFFIDAFRMAVPPVQTALTAAKAFLLFFLPSASVPYHKIRSSQTQPFQSIPML